MLSCRIRCLVSRSRLPIIRLRRPFRAGGAVCLARRTGHILVSRSRRSVLRRSGRTSDELGSGGSFMAPNGGPANELPTGSEHLESFRDGRETYVNGECCATRRPIVLFLQCSEVVGDAPRSRDGTGAHGAGRTRIVRHTLFKPAGSTTGPERWPLRLRRGPIVLRPVGGPRATKHALRDGLLESRGPVPVTTTSTCETSKLSRSA
jgi:hypothetical protein